jgi:hypothetical protein
MADAAPGDGGMSGLRAGEVEVKGGNPVRKKPKTWRCIWRRSKRVREGGSVVAALQKCSTAKPWTQLIMFWSAF